MLQRSSLQYQNELINNLQLTVWYLWVEGDVPCSILREYYYTDAHTLNVTAFVLFFYGRTTNKYKVITIARRHAAFLNLPRALLPYVKLRDLHLKSFVISRVYLCHTNIRCPITGLPGHKGSVTNLLEPSRITD